VPASPDSRQRRAQRLALAGILGPVAFGLTAVVGGAIESGYSPVHSYISELAAEGSGVRVLMTTGFLVLGLCIVVFAYALRVLRPAAVLLVLVVALSGVGTLMAGTFSCDEGCPTKGQTSTHQDLHNVSSVITFSSWIIAPLVAARQLRGTRYALASLALGAGALVVGLVLGSFADHAPDDPVGALQRAELLVVGVWFVVTTFELRSSPA